MSVKVGEIWDTVPASGLCVSPRRSGPPRRYGPQTGVSLDLIKWYFKPKWRRFASGVCKTSHHIHENDMARLALNTRDSGWCGIQSWLSKTTPWTQNDNMWSTCPSVDLPYKLQYPIVKTIRSNMLARTSKMTSQSMRNARTFLHYVGRSRRMTSSVVVWGLVICCWVVFYQRRTFWAAEQPRQQRLSSLLEDSQTPQVIPISMVQSKTVITPRPHFKSKTIILGIEIPVKKLAILSLPLESLYWQDYIFMLREPPVH